MTKGKTVIVIGATISGNRGAETMLCTTIGKIRETSPETKFIVYSYYPKVDRELLLEEVEGVEIVDARPLPMLFCHFPRWTLYKAGQILGLKSLSRFFRLSKGANTKEEDTKEGSSKDGDTKEGKIEAVIDISGESFNDYRLIYLPYKILCVLLGRLNGIPTYKLPQSMGPFSSPLNRFFAKHCLTWCSKVYARGQDTESFLEKLRLPKGHTARASDIGFLYKDSYRLSNENQKPSEDALSNIRLRKKNGNKIAVLIPSNVKFDTNGACYLNQLTQVIEHLFSLDYFLVILPHAFRDGCRQKHNNDLLLIEEIENIIAAQQKSQLLSIKFACPTHGIRSFIAEADLVITSRFHGMINALALGKAPLVLGWSHKYREVLEDLSVRELEVPADLIDTPLITAVEELILRQEELSNRVKEALPAVSRKVEEIFQGF